MPIALSAYFEIVRFGAAIVVLVSHAWLVFFPHVPLPWPGHQAVVVFFVLSGYVISHAAGTKDRSLRTYVLSRASRLLCVTVPALALGAIITLFAGNRLVDLTWPLLLNLTFLAQSWNLDVVAPANDPYWSLCYEVWYYAIFGAAFYLTGSTRWISAALACLLAGPKILILMPCWLIGVALHKNIHRFRPDNIEAAGWFTGSVVAYLVFFWFDVSVAIRGHLAAIAPNFVYDLSGSNLFVGDTILAIIVAANFIAVAKLCNRPATHVAITRPIAAWFAGTTLSLYLFHAPVIEFLQHAGYQGIAPFFAAFAIPFALAFVTEHRRKWLRSIMLNSFTFPRRALS